MASNTRAQKSKSKAVFAQDTEVDQIIESGQGNTIQSVFSTVPDVEIDDDDREIITSTDEILARDVRHDDVFSAEETAGLKQALRWTYAKRTLEGYQGYVILTGFQSLLTSK